MDQMMDQSYQMFIFSTVFVSPFHIVFLTCFFFQENKINQRECRDSYGQAANVRFKRITEEVGVDGEFAAGNIGNIRIVIVNYCPFRTVIYV